jgi:hypothetical protein
MVAYVGLDPRKDLNVVTHPGPESIRLLSEGKIDAYLGFPPEPQEMREQQIGHVVVNSTVDRPWSQYFCCLLAGNREFVRTHPVAAKRAFRAILKAADVCALEPEQSAQFIVDQGYTKRYGYALQVMKDIPYGQWREYSAEDTLRFYSLRLHEVGMIKSSPQKLIAQGTDWRFFEARSAVGRTAVEDFVHHLPRADPGPHYPNRSPGLQALPGGPSAAQAQQRESPAGHPQELSDLGRGGGPPAGGAASRCGSRLLKTVKILDFISHGRHS